MHVVLCVFIHNFFLMARLANKVLRSHPRFDPARNLTRRDVATNQHGLSVSVLTLSVLWKTGPECDFWEFPLPRELN